MNQKGISKLVIAVIIVVVVLVVGVTAYWAMSSGGGGKGTTEVTSEGTTEGTSESTTEGTGDGGTTPDVAGASSLRFKVSVTHAGVDQGVYTYMMKNAGTASVMLRVELATSEGDYIYIINGAQQKAWVYADGEWTDFSAAYSTYWDTWNSSMEGYRTNLEAWTGVGDWSYTTPDGDSIRIYDIDLNPSLANSLFEP